MMPTFWSRMRPLFDSGDGALPEICIGRLEERQVVDVYLLIRSLGTSLVGFPLIRDMRDRCDKPLDSIADPAELVVQAKVEPFHFLIRGIAFNARRLPDLGVYILPDAVAIDYQCGPEWREPQVNALFELLRRIRRIAPLANITLQEIPDPSLEARFDDAFRDYCRRNPPNTAP